MQIAEPDFFSRQVSGAKRFYRSLNPLDPREIAVVAGGCETCNPGYMIVRESFPYFAIEFLAGGSGTLVLKGKTSQIHPGAVFAYGPGVPHSIHNHQATPLRKYFVTFTGARAEKLLTEELGLLGELRRTSSPHSIQASFEELVQYGLTYAPFSDRICGTLVEALLYKIAQATLPGKASDSPAFATYQRCREIIAQEYLRLRSLLEIAQACAIDPSYLCRLYQRFDSQTPYQHLLRLQMNHAADQLLIPHKLVKEIAYEMGFNDPFHFSRTFKRVFGISPAQFARIRWK